MAADNTTNNVGLVPTPQLSEVINGIANADRGAVDAISRATLPPAGMTFEIPKITTAPTVAIAAEEAAISETDMASSFVSVNVRKFAGQQTFSQEILDRSQPAFFDELVRQMEFAYAKATDEAVATALATNGTDGGNRTFDASGLLGFVADAAGSIYSNSLGFARSLVVSPAAWSRIMGLNDAGRPIYNAQGGIENAGGTVAANSLRGNVAGLNLYVSRSFAGVGDNSMIVVNPDAYTFYESPRLSLRTNVINTGQIDVSYIGYGAIATKLGAGAYRFMVA